MLFDPAVSTVTGIPVATGANWMRAHHVTQACTYPQFCRWLDNDELPDWFQSLVDHAVDALLDDDDYYDYYDYCGDDYDDEVYEQVDELIAALLGPIEPVDHVQVCYRQGLEVHQHAQLSPHPELADSDIDALVGICGQLDAGARAFTSIRYTQPGVPGVREAGWTIADCGLHPLSRADLLDTPTPDGVERVDAWPVAYGEPVEGTRHNAGHDRDQWQQGQEWDALLTAFAGPFGDSSTITFTVTDLTPPAGHQTGTHPHPRIGTATACRHETIWYLTDTGAMGAIITAMRDGANQSTLVQVEALLPTVHHVCEHGAETHHTQVATWAIDKGHLLCFPADPYSSLAPHQQEVDAWTIALPPD